MPDRVERVEPADPDFSELSNASNAKDASTRRSIRVFPTLSATGEPLRSVASVAVTGDA
jgi:hypothetical protein